MRAAAVWIVAAAAAACAVAAAAQAVHRQALALTEGPVARRYCTCHDKGDRRNRTFQTCIIRKDSLHGLVCRFEIRPHVSPWYAYSPGIQGIYMLFSNELTYYEAEDVCDEENARLAVPLNEQGYVDLHDEMKRRRELFALLGISDRKVEGNFVDSDGGKPPYLPWGEGSPSNEHDKDCVRVYGRNVIEDAPCYNYRNRNTPFVCERRMSKRIPDGYTYWRSDQRFYKFYKKDLKDHATARRRCLQDGGTLAAFESWTSAEVYRTLMPKSIYRKVWVDYTDEGAELRFVTSTGLLMDDTDYIYWGENEPNNTGRKNSTKNCVFMRAEGEYHDEDCSKQFEFLCQIKEY